VSDLNEQEQAHVRAALAYLHTRFGTWRLVAKALHAKYWSLRRVIDGNDNASASIAFRVARLGGASIDALLAGKWPDPNTCPHCGQRKKRRY
jgi:hypothetical protein